MRAGRGPLDRRPQPGRSPVGGGAGIRAEQGVCDRRRNARVGRKCGGLVPCRKRSPQGRISSLGSSSGAPAGVDGVGRGGYARRARRCSPPARQTVPLRQGEATRRLRSCCWWAPAASSRLRLPARRRPCSARPAATSGVSARAGWRLRMRPRSARAVRDPPTPPKGLKQRPGRRRGHRPPTLPAGTPTGHRASPRPARHRRWRAAELPAQLGVPAAGGRGCGIQRERRGGGRSKWTAGPARAYQDIHIKILWPAWNELAFQRLGGAGSHYRHRRHRHV